jgi:transcriptional regulator with XRE-family HTH domain
MPKGSNPEGRQIGFQFGHVAGTPDPIWELIREERLKRHLSMDEVGVLAGVASSTVSRGERGYQIWLSKTRQVAQALGITIFTVMTPSQADGGIE